MAGSVSRSSPAPHCFHPIAPERPFLLVADIDGTLLGDEQGEASLRQICRDHPSSFRLALATGRPLWSVTDLISQGRLPQPVCIGSSVGTELLDCEDPTNRMGNAYAARAASDWDVEAIYAIGEGEGIHRQQFERGQPRFQAGFYWDGRTETMNAFLERVAVLEEYRVVVSSGRYVDVVPRCMGKGELALFVRQRMGIEPERVVVAGDSGNDREMFDTGLRGVVPCNALAELKNRATEAWHYSSPLPAGRGVIDGLCHFGLLRSEAPP